MRTALSVILILLCLPSAATTQQTQSAASDGDIRISKDSPAIYITFERRGRAVNPMTARLAETDTTSSQTGPGRDYVLRLHNNTRWAIEFPTWSLYLGGSVSPLRLSNGTGVLGLKDNIEVNAVYRVEESDGRVVPNGGDVSSKSWVPSGQSVIFSVDRGHLSNGRSIYIYFNYEWESGEKYSNNLAPEHRAMYWGHRLRDEDR